MKKIILSFLSLVACVSIFAQDSSKLMRVSLKDGTKFNAYVEKQVDGGYKLTTEDGSVFFFREGEITINNSVQSLKSGQKELKYRELKKIYSAKDYHGREPGDKYSPAAMGVASFFVPGLGQYITGCQVGWGVLQTFLGELGLFFGVSALASGAPEYSSPLAVWAGMGIWSCCSAVKAAKIKNLYYRDIKSGVAYNFELTPYFDVTTPVLASNQQYVAGLSFRVSF